MVMGSVKYMNGSASFTRYVSTVTHIAHILLNYGSTHFANYETVVI